MAMSVILKRSDPYTVGTTKYVKGDTITGLTDYEARRLVDTGEADFVAPFAFEGPECMPPWKNR